LIFHGFAELNFPKNVTDLALERASNFLSALRPEDGHVIYEGASSRKTLLIVFAYIDQKVGTRSHSSFLRGIDCKKLFLNPGQNAWYQTGVPGAASTYSELAAFLMTVKAAHPEHEILCLGHSMGGFAALGMGIHIGADRILASVPEYVLNCPGSVSARHMGETPIQCGDLRQTLSQNARSQINVLVGSDNAFDVSMAKDIAALTPTDVISLTCGHGTFPYLRDNKKLGSLLDAFVRGAPLRPVVTGL
jgi:pimeloyl-ACP methyl ester carboxylesterase